MREEWKGFTTGEWAKEVNVRDFIQKNYTPYDGDASFLAGPTQATTDLWNQVLDLQKQEEQQAAYLIWIQRLYRQSHHTAQVT